MMRISKNFSAYFCILFLFVVEAIADQEVRNIPIILDSKPLRIEFVGRVSPGIPSDQFAVTVGGMVNSSLGNDSLDSNTRFIDFIDVALSSPAYYLWNSFLEMENILTLYNKDSDPIGGDITLFAPGGNQIGSLPFFLFGDGQFDFPLSFIPGYQKPAFGVAQINVSQESFDGSAVRYRFDPTNSPRLEFMTGMELRNPISGTSYVFFNTMQPSRRPNQLSNEVSNWLSIANVDNKVSRVFDVIFYNLLGQVIRTQAITVPNMGRVDIEAGHVNPGPRNLGMIEIIPRDFFTNYLATMSRYGASAAVSSLAKFFPFATSLPSRNSDFFTQVLPVTSESNAETWVVVGNASNSVLQAELNFFSSSGVLTGTRTELIPAKAQRHILANLFIPTGTSGSVAIEAISGFGLVAEKTTYYFNPTRMETTAAASAMSASPNGSLLFGSYNRFLGMGNIVKIQNFGESATTGTLEVIENSASLGTTGFNTPLDGLSQIGIESLGSPPAINTFGPLRLNSGSSFSAVGHVLRLQPSLERIDVIDAATMLPMQKTSSFSQSTQ
jgi:hypothetical protein